MAQTRCFDVLPPLHILHAELALLLFPRNPNPNMMWHRWLKIWHRWFWSLRWRSHTPPIHVQECLLSTAGYTTNDVSVGTIEQSCHHCTILLSSPPFPPKPQPELDGTMIEDMAQIKDDAVVWSLSPDFHAPMDGGWRFMLMSRAWKEYEEWLWLYQEIF